MSELVVVMMGQRRLRRTEVDEDSGGGAGTPRGFLSSAPFAAVAIEYYRSELLSETQN